MDLDKRVRLNFGFALVLLLSAIPMFAWYLDYDFSQLETWQIIALSLAKMGAFGGMAMFALSLILSGRFKIFDKLFGGLDKMYIAHRFLGTFSLILLFIHPVSLSLLRLERGTMESLSLWFKWSNFGVWLGGIALYTLLAVILITVFLKLRYEVFLLIHKLLGFAFAAGAIHAFLAGSILSAQGFMYWYFLVLTVVAITTFILYSILGDLLHHPLTYQLIDATVMEDDIVSLKLIPTTRAIKFAPGQFVYIRFEELKGHGYHPFSISSSRSSSELTLAVRQAGDFSTIVKKMSPGAKVKVKGPYGGFILQHSSKKKQMWIAGGIGVTPFLSAAQSLGHMPRSRGGDIEMIYSSKDKRPFGMEILQKVEEENKIFNVTRFDDQTFGFVSLELLGLQHTDLAEREIYVCGPPGMLAALQSEADRLGLSKQLHYEEFSF